MTVRTRRERIFQTLAFELGGLAIATPTYGLIMGVDAFGSILLVVATSLAVMAWSPLHNHLFDSAEWRLARRVASDRPSHWRLVHAISHEVTTTVVTLPVIMVVGGYGFWTALAIDLALTVFYVGYAYIFHIIWDRWRPVPPGPRTGVPLS